MKERLTNNLFIKLISVCIALLIWIMVVNLSNPLKTKSVTDIPLEVLNDKVLTDAGLTYEIEGKKTVSVSVVVRTLDFNKIQKSDFRAYVDLKDLWSVTGTVPVRIEVVSNKNLMEGTPVSNTDVVHVVTEPIQEKAFSVRVNSVGALSDGYAMGTTTLSPSVVKVKGPESMVGMISSVGIEINLDGKEGDFSGKARTAMYDANGHELDFGSKVTINTEEVEFEQVILRIKELALNFEVTGEVADGYRFTGISSPYKSVPVAGFKSVLAELTSLHITDAELNLDGLTGDKKVSIDLNKFLPSASLSLAGMESSVISVTLNVERLVSQDFMLDTSNISMVGKDHSCTYEIDEEQIEVTVQGLKEDLEKLEPEQLQAFIDVSELAEGSHQGSLDFNLEDSFMIQSYSPFIVTVKARYSSPGQAQTVSGTEAEETSQAESEEETKESETKS